MSSITVSGGSGTHTMYDSAKPAVLGTRADCLMVGSPEKVGYEFSGSKNIGNCGFEKNPVV